LQELVAGSIGCGFVSSFVEGQSRSMTGISEMAPVRNDAVKGTSFGCIEGVEACLFTLDNGEITVRVTDYGGRLVSIEAADRGGRHADVLLGFRDAVAYDQTPGSFGSLLGRNANGIADGSAADREGLCRQSAGVAFEPQGFPNASNQQDFLSTILQPGDPYHEEIIYRFRTDREGAAA